MHYVRPVLAAAMVTCMMGVASGVLAHGESGHGKPKAAFDPAKVEDKPFGRAGDPRKARRTVTISMDDRMRFVAMRPQGQRHSDVGGGTAPHSMPADLTVNRGEIVRFVVHNDGKVMHEMVIGSLQELREHAELMRKFPGMEHDEPYMAHVPPGQKGEIVWQFTRAGEFHYACLIPGHMEAGMIAKITVK